jgi:hypothetical protein
MIAKTLYIHVNNNKTDLLPKFESLKCNSFGFIQNIILLHIHIHEQYFILSLIYYKVCHNEWDKKFKKLINTNNCMEN